MILGHFAAAFAGDKLAFGRFPNPVALFFLAFLPDLLDKNLYYVFGMTSRGYFHSLPVAGALCLLVFLAARISGGLLDPALAGRLLFFYVLHLACDRVDPAVLFWPFELGGGGSGFGFRPLEAGAFDFWTIVRRFYVLRVYPVWLLAEIICFALAFFLLGRSWLAGEFRIPPPGLHDARGDEPAAMPANRFP